jgi:[ribosomal protein S5]-alanine N-acetyltransferase
MHDVFLTFPVIDLQIVKLRQLHPSDTEDFYHFLCNEEVQKFLSIDDIPENLEAAKVELMYWANLYTMLKSIYWGIVIPEDDRLIGTCGFNTWNRTHKRAEISYDLSHDYWGQGVMTRAAMAITKFAFDNMGVQRVQATVAEDNVASIKVLEKCGYQKEGLLNKFGILHKKSKNFYMYART